MNKHPSLVRLGLGAALVLLAVGSPALADYVPAGADLWATAGNTHTSFASDPIPAGFFCPESKPFTGRIAFQGAPLAVQPAKSLDGADTIVRRLDNAVFDTKGEAVTRIQLMALSLVSAAPVDTGCGLYNVTASLERGEQPMTTMRIVRTAKTGGTYVAPLSLKVRLVFTPVSGDKSGRRELTRPVTLGPATNAVWAFASKPTYHGRITVDTDGDGRPDTVLPKASNFVAGVAPAASTGPVIIPAACRRWPNATGCPAGQTLHQACHCNSDQSTWDPYDEGINCPYLHCLWVCI
jgi:hypothetical protein